MIKATTKSGLGVTTPTGTVYASYGSFGTANVGFNLAYGDAEVGQFHRGERAQLGEIPGSSEFQAIHAKGNEEKYLTGSIISSRRKILST